MSDSVKVKARNRSIQLFTYLRESILQKTKVIRDLDNYEEIIGFSDIPKINGSKCITWSPLSPEKDPTEDWIELRKPKRIPPPLPQKELEDWVIKDSLLDSSSHPKILKSIVISSGNGDVLQTTVLELQQHPHIQKNFLDYENQWKVWAENDKVEKNLEIIYKKIFSIYQKHKKFGEAYELLVGFCLLKYKNGSHEIKRHLFTTQATILFDQKSGKLTVSGSSEGVKLLLEEDMLEVVDRPIPENIISIENMMKECDDQIWDGISIHELGKAYAHAIPSGDGEYYEKDDHRQFTMSSKPQVIYSPYLVLRKNTDRSLLNVYNSLINAISAGAAVPPGIMHIVGVKAETEESYTNEKSAKSETNNQPELYFPLEANKEQKEIAEKLHNNSAVLVQGPPGTGKSHTIANLICHLLSQGKRILVTSHTTRALAVLKNKIPKDVAPLCVELLGSDHGSMKSLEDSVYGILSKYNTWDTEKSLSKLDKLEKLLKEKKSEYAVCTSQLREIREKDTFTHNKVNGVYTGTMESIAKQIRQETTQFSWFKDELQNYKDEISSSIVLTFFRLHPKAQQIPLELINAHLPLEDLQKLLSIENLFIEESNILALLADSELKYENKNLISKLDDKKIQSLNELSQQIKTLSRGLSTHSSHWHTKAFFEILEGKEAIWKKRLQESANTILEIEKIENKLPRKVTGVDKYPAGQIRFLVNKLITHFNSGGGFGFWLFKPKIINEADFIFKELSVNDISCKEHKETLQLLDHYLNAEMLFTDFLHLWEGLFEFDSKIQSIKIEQAREIINQLKNIIEISKAFQLVHELIGANLKDKSIESLATLMQEIFIITNRHVHKTIKIKIERASEVLNQSFNSDLIKKYASRLKLAIEDRDLSSIHSLLKNLEDINDKKKTICEYSRIKTVLENNLPRLYLEFLKDCESPIWEERFQVLTEAIALRLTQKWLESHNDPNRLKQLNLQQEQLRKEIQQIISALASEWAWYQCFSNKGRFGDEQRESLVAWQRAVARIGKGTGKHANRHRKDARMHMEACRPAIPAWIMPMHKVAEVTEIAPESFDVVILDEASQSGPEAIFLQYIGKKIVVVGDDKQISPDNVGIDRDGLYSIHQRYLGDIPRSDVIGPDNSFFDIADVRYGGRIRLREHFRCMPEIIQFSNNLCYSSEPLIPLKQYGMNRISPVVSAIYCKNGYMSGTETKKINGNEAEAIVNKVYELIKDPQYKDKTIGIISLLGEWQAKEIEKLLINKIGPEEVDEREIVCGDAYAFQGDERDIMILSLVSAVEEGRRIGALTKEKDKRRFNVAASRAKEQMFLFHSVTLNDLNPECMRYKILDYCMNPKVDQIEINGLNIESIKTLHSSADKATMNPPSPFDSWFEVDVFLQIHTMGYRVIPQYEVNGRRIDLVVEGMSGRIAVECDGDRWHGPDQFDQDMARQRDLERCGWVFYRIRGSEYALSPDKILESLWGTLSKMGIHPNGQKHKVHEDSPKVTFEIEKEDSTGIKQTAQQSFPTFLGLDDNWAKSLNETNIANALIKLGLEVKDKRELNGALWVVGDTKLKPLMILLQKYGLKFTFAQNGSKTTGSLAAWFMK